MPSSWGDSLKTLRNHLFLPSPLGIIRVSFFFSTSTRERNDIYDCSVLIQTPKNCVASTLGHWDRTLKALRRSFRNRVAAIKTAGVETGAKSSRVVRVELGGPNISPRLTRKADRK